MIFEKDSDEIRWAAELFENGWHARAQRALEAASGAGVFERLAKEPVAAERLAEDLGLDPTAAEKVLIVLAAMGLVDRDGDAWRLTPKAEATLLPDAPCYQGNMLAHTADVWAFWSDLESALHGEKGGWVFDPAGRPPVRSHRNFILGMHNVAMAGRAAELVERVDLSEIRTRSATGRRTLMDVGGGPGTYAAALCERYPDLTATVMDLPETIEIARGVIEKLGMSDRVRTVAGDWNEDEFGAGNDAVLLSSVLHGPTSAAEMKLEKARRSMKPGGLLIIQDFVMNAEKTGPLIPAVFNVMVGAFSLTELADRIAAAGFSGLQVKPMPRYAGTTVLTAVR